MSASVSAFSVLAGTGAPPPLIETRFVAGASAGAALTVIPIGAAGFRRAATDAPRRPG